jgi:hypothetical protein
LRVESERSERRAVGRVLGRLGVIVVFGHSPSGCRELFDFTADRSA